MAFEQVNEAIRKTNIVTNSKRNFELCIVYHAGHEAYVQFRNT